MQTKEGWHNYMKEKGAKKLTKQFTHFSKSKQEWSYFLSLYRHKYFSLLYMIFSTSVYFCLQVYSLRGRSTDSNKNTHAGLWSLPVTQTGSPAAAVQMCPSAANCIALTLHHSLTDVHKEALMRLTSALHLLLLQSCREKAKTGCLDYLRLVPVTKTGYFNPQICRCKDTEPRHSLSRPLTCNLVCFQSI